MPPTSSVHIPYSQPWLTEREALASAQVIRSGRLVLGPEVRAFETALAKFTHRARAVCVTSGTSALQLAMQVLGVGPGWSVIVPAYTWVATWNVAHWLGAEPILMDVDPNTFCLDPADFERALAACTHSRVAMLPVHMFGYRVDPDWLDEAIAHHDLTIVGDGCCAFGGTHRGRRCGAWTSIECLSFHPRKVITTGEGGAILLDNQALADRLERLRDHGAQRSRKQRDQTGQGGMMTPVFPEPGHNLRMTEMQGALGRVQMERVTEIIHARQRIAAHYDAQLAVKCPWITRPPGHSDPGRVLTCYAVQFRLAGTIPAPDTTIFKQLAAHRDAVATSLSEQGIVARPPMIHLLNHGFTVDSRRGYAFPGTQAIASLTLGLPFFPEMTHDQVDAVVHALAAHPTPGV